MNVHKLFITLHAKSKNSMSPLGWLLWRAAGLLLLHEAVAFPDNLIFDIQSRARVLHKC